MSWLSDELSNFEDWLFHGGLEDDIKDILRKFDDEIIQPIYEFQKDFVNAVLDDPLEAFVQITLALTGNGWLMPVLQEVDTYQQIKDLQDQGYNVEDYDLGEGLLDIAKGYALNKISGEIGQHVNKYKEYIPNFPTQLDGVLIDATFEGINRGGAALVLGDSASDAFSEYFNRSLSTGVAGELIDGINDAGAAVLGFVDKKFGSLNFIDEVTGLTEDLPEVVENVIAASINAELEGKEVTSEVIASAVARSNVVATAIGKTLNHSAYYLQSLPGADADAVNQTLSFLTTGFQNAVGVALAGGTGEQAATMLLASLDAMGQQEFRDFLDRSIIGDGLQNALDFMSGDYGRTKAESEALQAILDDPNNAVHLQRLDQLNGMSDEINTLRDEQASAVQAYNTVAEPFNSLAGEFRVIGDGLNKIPVQIFRDESGNIIGTQEANFNVTIPAFGSNPAVPFDPEAYVGAGGWNIGMFDYLWKFAQPQALGNITDGMLNAAPQVGSVFEFQLGQIVDYGNLEGAPNDLLASIEAGYSGNADAMLRNINAAGDIVNQKRTALDVKVDAYETVAEDPAFVAFMDIYNAQSARVIDAMEDLGTSSGTFQDTFSGDFNAINTTIAKAMDPNFDAQFYTAKYGGRKGFDVGGAAGHFLATGSKEGYFTNEQAWDAATQNGAFAQVGGVTVYNTDDLVDAEQQQKDALIARDTTTIKDQQKATLVEVFANKQFADSTDWANRYNSFDYDRTVDVIRDDLGKKIDLAMGSSALSGNDRDGNVTQDDVDAYKQKQIDDANSEITHQNALKAVGDAYLSDLASTANGHNLHADLPDFETFKTDYNNADILAWYADIEEKAQWLADNGANLENMGKSSYEYSTGVSSNINSGYDTDSTWRAYTYVDGQFKNISGSEVDRWLNGSPSDGGKKINRWRYGNQYGLNTYQRTSALEDIYDRGLVIEELYYQLQTDIQTNYDSADSVITNNQTILNDISNGTNADVNSVQNYFDVYDEIFNLGLLDTTDNNIANAENIARDAIDNAPVVLEEGTSWADVVANNANLELIEVDGGYQQVWVKTPAELQEAKMWDLRNGTQDIATGVNVDVLKFADSTRFFDTLDEIKQQDPALVNRLVRAEMYEIVTHASSGSVYDIPAYHIPSEVWRLAEERRKEQARIDALPAPTTPQEEAEQSGWQTFLDYWTTAALGSQSQILGQLNGLNAVLGGMFEGIHLSYGALPSSQFYELKEGLTPGTAYDYKSVGLSNEMTAYADSLTRLTHATAPQALKDSRRDLQRWNDSWGEYLFDVNNFNEATGKYELLRDENGDLIRRDFYIDTTGQTGAELISSELSNEFIKQAGGIKHAPTTFLVDTIAQEVLESTPAAVVGGTAFFGQKLAGQAGLEVTGFAGRIAAKKLEDQMQAALIDTGFAADILFAAGGAYENQFSNVRRQAILQGMSPEEADKLADIGGYISFTTQAANLMLLKNVGKLAAEEALFGAVTGNRKKFDTIWDAVSQRVDDVGQIAVIANKEGGAGAADEGLLAFSDAMFINKYVNQNYDVSSEVLEATVFGYFTEGAIGGGTMVAKDPLALSATLGYTFAPGALEALDGFNTVFGADANTNLIMASPLAVTTVSGVNNRIASGDITVDDAVQEMNDFFVQVGIDETTYLGTSADSQTHMNAVRSNLLNAVNDADYYSSDEVLEQFDSLGYTPSSLEVAQFTTAVGATPLVTEIETYVDPFIITTVDVDNAATSAGFNLTEQQKRGLAGKFTEADKVSALATLPTSFQAFTFPDADAYKDYLKDTHRWTQAQADNFFTANNIAADLNKYSRDYIDRFWGGTYDAAVLDESEVIEALRVATNTDTEYGRKTYSDQYFRDTYGTLISQYRSDVTGTPDLNAVAQLDTANLQTDVDYQKTEARILQNIKLKFQDDEMFQGYKKYYDKRFDENWIKTTFATDIAALMARGITKNENNTITDYGYDYADIQTAVDTWKQNTETAEKAALTAKLAPAQTLIGTPETFTDPGVLGAGFTTTESGALPPYAQGFTYDLNVVVDELWRIGGSEADAEILNQLVVDYTNKWGYPPSSSDIFRLGHDLINQDLYEFDGDWTRNADNYPRNPAYATGDNRFSQAYNAYRKYDMGGNNAAPNDLDTYAPAANAYQTIKDEFVNSFGYTPDDAQIKQFMFTTRYNIPIYVEGDFDIQDRLAVDVLNYMDPRQLSNAEAEDVIVATYAKGTPEYNALIAKYGNKTGGVSYQTDQTVLLQDEIAGMVETARIAAETTAIDNKFKEYSIDVTTEGIDISSFYSDQNGTGGIEAYVITNYPDGTHVNNLKSDAIISAILDLDLDPNDFTPEEIAGIAANITGTTKADIQDSVNAQSYVNTFTGALEYTAGEARTDLAAALNITNVADIPADFDDYIISLANEGLTDALAANRVANEVAAAEIAFGAYIQNNEELADALDGTITDVATYIEPNQYTRVEAERDLRAELGLAADADVSAYDTYLEGLVDMTGGTSNTTGKGKVETEIIGDQDLRDALEVDYSQSIPTDLSAFTGLASDESLQDRVKRITPTFKTDKLLDKEQDARNILDEAANFGDEGAYLSTDAGYETLVNYQANYALENDLDYAQFKANVITAVNNRRYSEQEIAADIIDAFPQERGKTVAELKASGNYDTLFDLAGTGNPQFDRDQTLTFDDLTISDADLRGQLGDYTLPTDLSGFTGLASDKDLAGRVADYKAQPGVYDTVTTQIRTDIVTYLNNAGLSAENPNRENLIDYYSTGAGRSVFDGLDAAGREAKIAGEVNLRDYTEREVAQDIITAFAPTNQDGSPKDVDTILLEKSTGVDGGVYDTLFNLAQEAQTNDTNFDATQRIAFGNNVVTKQDAVDHFLGLGYSQSDIDTVPELKNAIEALSGVRTKADFGTDTDVTTLQTDTTVTALDIKAELKANKEAYGFVDDAAVDALDDDTLLADFGGNYYKNDLTTGLGTKLADATVSGDDIRAQIGSTYDIDASAYTDQDLRDAGFTFGIAPSSGIASEIVAGTVSDAAIRQAFQNAGIDVYEADIADYLGRLIPTGTTFEPTAGELADTRYRRLQETIANLEAGQLNPTDAAALQQAGINITSLQDQINELKDANFITGFTETDPIATGKIDALIQGLKDYLTSEQISDLVKGIVGTEAEGTGVYNYIDGLIDQLNPRVGALEDAVGSPAAEGTESTGLYKLIDDLTLLGLDDDGVIAAIKKRIGDLEGVSETDAIALAAIGTADDAAGTATLYGYLKQQNATRDQRLDDIDLEIGVPAEGETAATGLYAYMDNLIASLPAGYTQTEMEGFATSALNDILGETTSEDTSELYGYVNSEIATLAGQIGDVEDEVSDIQDYIDSLGKPDDPDTADIDETSGIYAYIRDAIANGSIDEAGAQTLIEQIFGTQAVEDNPATTDIDESAAATGIYQYIDGLDLADTTSVSASIDAAVTNLQNYITGEGFQTENDIRRLVGEIVGKEAREVTANDITFVEAMLDPDSATYVPPAGMAFEPTYTEGQIAYDVDGDGYVTQADLDLLNQIYDPTTYGDPTGLTGQSAFESTGIYDIFGDIQTQQELDAETNLNMFNEINTRLERDRQDDLARRAKEEQEQYMNELQQLSRVNVTTPDVAKIDYLYDLYGDSIFATPEQEALFASPYGARKRPTPMGAEGLNLAPRAAAEGGLITDQTDELLKLLGN